MKYVITSSTKVYDSLERAKAEVEELMLEGDLWDDTVIYKAEEYHYPSVSWRLKKLKK